MKIILKLFKTLMRHFLRVFFFLLIPVRNDHSTTAQARAIDAEGTRQDDILAIPRDRGINAMWDFDPLSHPLTSQMERAWLGAKK